VRGCILNVHYQFSSPCTLPSREEFLNQGNELSLSDPDSPDLGGATCIDLTCDLQDHQYLLREREEEIVTLAEHLKEANRKPTEMRGKLQQKKQVINEYRLSVGKAEQEIVELNESQLKLNTLRVGQTSEMTSWKCLFGSRMI
jgi:hypothetical protein